MKVRMKIRPTGYISINGGPLSEWPKVGAVVEFPDIIAEDLIGDGRAEKIRVGKTEPIAEIVEARPEITDEVEKRGPGRPRKTVSE